MKKNEVQKNLYNMNKIRMGDITGPCGNTKCVLAHKVRNYIRNMEVYKKEVGEVSGTSKETTRKFCGTCSCKHDRKCAENKISTKTKCSDCIDIFQMEKPFVNTRDKLNVNGLGPSPSGNQSTTTYLCSKSKSPFCRKSSFENNYVVENLTTNYDFQNDALMSYLEWRSARGIAGQKPEMASCGTQKWCKCSRRTATPLQSIGVNTVNVFYTAEVRQEPDLKKYSVFNCTAPQEDNECKCKPPKPTPPCKTFDCECITETGNIAARKHHKPYCPCFKHKITCPVMLKKEDEEKKKLEEEEEEAEPLPYGLPPIQLGPCPVMGKPCANPDGFARMYKTQAQPLLPASWSDAGKVCCSKEYERIKKAIKDYMRFEKDHDYRCINTFDIDTERRCCDKEQRLMALMGKDCCGSHKLALHKKFQEDKK